MNWIALGCVTGFLIASSALAQTTPINQGEEPCVNCYWVSNGFATGLDYLSQDAADRTAYMRGALDGLFSSVVMNGKNTPAERALSSCIQLTGKFTDVQLKNMADEYLRRHPEKQDQYMTGLIVPILWEKCPKS